nr:fatty acid desaturase family protein [Tanacetum cinerariifolium]
MKEMLEENQGLKNELEEIKKVNDVSLKNVKVYEKRVLDFDVRVLGLEKLGKELMDSPDFSDNQKNHVLGINFLLCTL